jgi:hypothetical protein
MSSICILTPDPMYEENWDVVAQHYRGLFGADIDFRPWNDASDLTSFGLVMPLIAWGYQRDPARWFKALDVWAGAGVRLANPVATLCWNTDKDYLFDLESAGVAIVPTIETHGLCAADLNAARAQFGIDVLVVKPSISGGADGTYRLSWADPIPFDVLEKEMLIQPLMASIADDGEYSLFYMGGTFSHAILKTPADGDFRVQEQFGGRERAIDPPFDAQKLAQAALAAAPEPTIYARVDMVRDALGHFALMELELIEPSLFLEHAADGGALLAAAVARFLS